METAFDIAERECRALSGRSLPTARVERPGEIVRRQREVRGVSGVAMALIVAVVIGGSLTLTAKAQGLMTADKPMQIVQTLPCDEPIRMQ